MYRHEAITLLQKHQKQCKSDIEIKPWMVDAVLEASMDAYANMGVEVSELQTVLEFDSDSHTCKTCDCTYPVGQIIYTHATPKLPRCPRCQAPL